MADTMRAFQCFLQLLKMFCVILAQLYAENILCDIPVGIYEAQPVSFLFAVDDRKEIFIHWQRMRFRNGAAGNATLFLRLLDLIACDAKCLGYFFDA